MQLRRRTRRRRTIDQQGTLMVFVSANIQAAKEGKRMNTDEEPDDEFRKLDEVQEEDLPLPPPIRKALTHGQRLQLLAWRRERGMRLFSPEDHR